jgi:hypothetical protein
MRSILGFGVVLAVAGLLATVETAYGQTGAAGQAGRGTGIGGAPASAANNVEQQVTNAAGTNATVPGQVVTTPPTAGGVTTMPPNTYQAPGTTGNVVNPAGGAPVYPGTTTPGTINPAAAPTTTYSSNYYAPGAQQGVYPGTGTAVTPGYTNSVMPGMAGYNSVNPMATTMAPGYYYAGTAGMPYAAGAPTRYSSMYVTPGYSTAPQTYTVQQRRGLFGGMFRRRNRVAYPATTYGTAPYGYTTYGTTTYTAPGTYTYSTSPY